MGLLLCGILIGTALPRPGADAAASDPLAAVTQTYQLLLKRFAGKVQPAVLIAGAIRGMTAAVGDPFTEYFAPSADQSFTDTLNGYSGVGLSIQVLGNNGAVIETVLAAAPAEKAGLRSGELIVSVDGTSTAGQTAQQVAGEIRGSAGTTVVLGVLAPGASTPKAYTLVRQQFNPITVLSSTPAPGIGELRITEFASTTASQFDQAYAKLQQQPGGLRGLILDLRNDPGGYVAAAVHIAGELAPAGPILIITGRDGQSTTYTAPSHPPAPPIVVLVNGETASAAEILAGALQYRHAALLVGSRTYGKGSVQQLFSLPGGAAVKITVSHDELPNGKSWNGVGLQPDVPVQPPAPPALPQLAAVGSRSLEYGMIGLDVYGLQQRLSVLGLLKEKASGIFDQSTLDAVEVFQRHEGLPPTGHMAQDDWVALGKAVSARIQQLQHEPLPDTVQAKGLQVLRQLMSARGPGAA